MDTLLISSLRSCLSLAPLYRQADWLAMRKSLDRWRIDWRRLEHGHRLPTRWPRRAHLGRAHSTRYGSGSSQCRLDSGAATPRLSRPGDVARRECPGAATIHANKCERNRLTFRQERARGCCPRGAPEGPDLYHFVPLFPRLRGAMERRNSRVFRLKMAHSGALVARGGGSARRCGTTLTVLRSRPGSSA